MFPRFPAFHTSKTLPLSSIFYKPSIVHDFTIDHPLPPSSASNVYFVNLVFSFLFVLSVLQKTSHLEDHGIQSKKVALERMRQKLRIPATIILSLCFFNNKSINF
ncbi:hypothetical protein L6452_09877 [Arctium lappa]|uniref:Uncharacterized protein n=1 Tax=Arctium lappa TaxID=4217 RepID=A0ACB9DLK4_ARCLA|nr:hypothetical protein L6452_09877 [Arctium lappa]